MDSWIQGLNWTPQNLISKVRLTQHFYMSNISAIPVANVQPNHNPWGCNKATSKEAATKTG